jgi:serine/threonine-protein kinase PRP4
VLSGIFESVQVGEIMDNRYEVYATHGKGVFSTVLRARDMAKKHPTSGAPIEVAIKVIRANDIMYKAGQTETIILRKLAGADPEGKRHVVQFIRAFDYRSHLCLVFESMVLAQLTTN